MEFLRTRGKDPQRNRGYAESNIRPIARRIHQVHQYCWENGYSILELTPKQADEFIEGLNRDEILNKDGEEYSEGSKRKFQHAINSYFRSQGIEWDPEIEFTDTDSSAGPDPFNLRERERLLKAALNYRSPPNYKNVSPDERDRWNTQLSQHLGKPKEQVGPDDWESLRRSWKIPSIISTTLDCGWRAEMIGRLEMKSIDIGNGQIVIPPDTAVKNNQKWECELSNRSSRILEYWMAERNNRPRYDNIDNIWLNRKGNPYNSGTLNRLLDNLIEEAEIEPGNRKLTWHSIRHSTGMYVYNQEKDLELVAATLRHASLEAARKYAHATPETKKEVIESIQGGVIL
ncbi:tyrosine-type recombinase/integrase [Halorientalis salina]|uniref:tyrosine-type recombinase/integrase n=1 Tax=Halorientalis salina TaxID=2932266 RepID=UPI0010AC7792|nr:site-specific integrase [Halorientalis salina]